MFGTVFTPAFVAVFAFFVLAIVVLSVVTVRWAIRRDRSLRRAASDRGGSPAP